MVVARESIPKKHFGYGYLILLLFLIPILIRWYIDFLWFRELGFKSVFLTILFTKLGLIAVVGAAFFVVAYLNVHIAFSSNGKTKESHILDLDNFSKFAIVLFISFLVGLSASNAWLTVLQFFHQVKFNLLDPVFLKDIAFYVFSLPFLFGLLKLLLFFTVVVFATTFIAYFARENILRLKKKSRSTKTPKDIPEMGMPNIPSTKLTFSKKAKYHLSGVAAFFFVLLGARYFLSRYEILYSPRGIITGAGFTDIYVTLPVLTILFFFSIFVAIILFGWPGHFKNKKFLRGLGITFIAVFIIGQSVLPGIVQTLKVLPNEVEVETPFIERNINFTRFAYGLDKIEEKAFDVQENRTEIDLVDNAETISNIRLWDNRPLEQTYKQLQEIRLYYDFSDVDIDRYQLNGRYTQLMLSPRELSHNQLPQGTRTWVNEHLVYTHGYGLTASPVNQITAEGLPELLVKDLPPKSVYSALNVDEPRIYYGELDNEYLVTKTTFEEFDYPKGDENIYTTYEGNGGVPVESFFRKLLFTLHFKDINILFSEYITPESRVMFRRNIQNRIDHIAPFIYYDEDPYMVIADGKLFWIQDAYTVTDRFPYSKKFNNGLNYIRNSVKVVVDAYNGDVTYYIIDDTDSIVKTYQNIFPALFKPFSEMPSEIKKHIRYPQDLFQIQSIMYGDYHMKDPRVFYNKEDKWAIPNEVYGEGTKISMDPYYIIMKLPGEEKEEFLLMTPFTPFKKDNMIGWLAARSDGEKYGKLIVYKFTKEKLIFGPMQVEARIDQDPLISEQISLWDQRGSSVIRGNLIIIPIDDQLLYVEPLYLLAESTQLPELKRVILFYNGKVVMEKTLDDAFAKIFSKEKIIEIKKEFEEKGISLDDLISKAIDLNEKIKKSMGEGNWGAIGDGLNELQGVLSEIEKSRSI